MLFWYFFMVADPYLLSGPGRVKVLWWMSPDFEMKISLQNATKNLSTLSSSRTLRRVFPACSSKDLYFILAGILLAATVFRLWCQNGIRSLYIWKEIIVKKYLFRDFWRRDVEINFITKIRRFFENHKQIRMENKGRNYDLKSPRITYILYTVNLFQANRKLIKQYR
jgi:hypothetical protein